MVGKMLKRWGPPLGLAFTVFLFWIHRFDTLPMDFTERGETELVAQSISVARLSNNDARLLYEDKYAANNVKPRAAFHETIYAFWLSFLLLRIFHRTRSAMNLPPMRKRVTFSFHMNTTS